MIWNVLLFALLLFAVVISGLALTTGTGHPRRRPH
jgi:hypothetical protein